VSECKIVTMGCRLNAFESEVIKGHIHKAKLENIIVINSCAVTQEAERQTRQKIYRAKREYPESRLVVTGCSAQINPERFAKMQDVYAVVGNAEKLDPNFWLDLSGHLAEAKIQVNDIMSVRETAGHLIQGFDGRSRAFIEVQQGCDHRCTFCVIPFGRGPSRSVPAGEIVNQINALVKKGFKEVVLTGVDLTDYGKGLPGSLNLTALVRKILKLVPELERLRLSSLDPMEMDDSLISLFGDEPRLLPSVHLSIQSGNNIILKRMKRRHQREDVIKVCEKLREKRPELTFGADLIVGFPTENEKMFEDTRTLVREAKITQLHVFPYSQRDGTPAQKMPQVPNQERKRRAKVLRSDGVAQLQSILDEGIGSEAKVLIENGERGHCERFLPVIMNKTYKTGEIVNTRIIARDGNYWIGEGIL